MKSRREPGNTKKSPREIRNCLKAGARILQAVKGIYRQSIETDSSFHTLDTVLGNYNFSTLRNTLSPFRKKYVDQDRRLLA